MTALGRLVEIDTRHVLPVVEAALASPDAGVRGFGVRALFDHPSAANIRLLGAGCPMPTRTSASAPGSTSTTWPRSGEPK